MTNNWRETTVEILSEIIGPVARIIVDDTFKIFREETEDTAKRKFEAAIQNSLEIKNNYDNGTIARTTKKLIEAMRNRADKR